MIPDAGPLMLTSTEQALHKAINQALPFVINMRNNGKAASSQSIAEKRKVWLGNETEKYFPYINPKCAVYSLFRAMDEITRSGKWELRNKSEGSTQRVKRLQGIAVVLRDCGSRIKSIKESSNMTRLESFLQKDADASVSQTQSPLDAGIICTDN